MLLEDEKVDLAELNKHFYEYGIQVYISVCRLVVGFSRGKQNEHTPF